MRKLCVVFCVMLVFVLGGTALAGEMKPSVSLGGQMGMPMGKFGDAWKMGFGGSGRVGFQISPQVEVGGTFCYGSYSFDEDGFLKAAGLAQYQDLLDLVGGSMSVKGADLTMLEFLADFKFFIPAGAEGAAFKPYLIATVGAASVSIDERTFRLSIPGYIDESLTEESLSKTAAMFGAGAGLEYMFSPKVGFWMDVQYRLTNLKIVPFVGSMDELTVGYLPIRAGVKIMFGGGE
jgi:opacity protein-like surface antigen